MSAILRQAQERACRVIEVDRTVIRYQARRSDDGALREKLRALAQERRRFGYRRLLILLRRDGVLINRKKTQRLYREEGLTVRRRKGRKRAVGTRTRHLCWRCRTNAGASTSCMTSLLQAAASGCSMSKPSLRRLRRLACDDVTRECLAAVAETSI